MLLTDNLVEAHFDELVKKKAVIHLMCRESFRFKFKMLYNRPSLNMTELHTQRRMFIDKHKDVD